MYRLGQSISRLGQKTLNFLVDDLPMSAYLLVFVSAIFLFAVAYTCLTPIGHGIGRNFEPLTDVTLWTGIYFSIVTVSSLGFGDLHPIGISKLLVSAEVLFGLTVMGIVIAKITSRRLSYHVSRLFSSDAQRRLDRIAERFESVKLDLRAIIGRLAAVYQNVPRSGDAAANGEREEQENMSTRDAERKNELILEFRGILEVLNSNCLGLRDYVKFECEMGDFFQSAPVDAVRRVGAAIDGTYFTLVQLIVSLPAEARAEILDADCRREISEAIGSQEIMSGLVLSHSESVEVRQLFEQIEETCKRVPASYYDTPADLAPDQFVVEGAEPQG